MRDETRRERYNKKLKGSIELPVSIGTIHFKHEVNLAYAVRASVCFGSPDIYVIGSVPPRRIMNELSGSLYDYLKVRQFKNTSAFLENIRKNDIQLISVELPEADSNFKARPLEGYKFDFSKKICVVVGNESIGVPVDILANSDEIIYISMSGVGYCLNTATAGTILLYEAAKQFKESNGT